MNEHELVKRMINAQFPDQRRHSIKAFLLGVIVVGSVYNIALISFVIWRCGQ